MERTSEPLDGDRGPGALAGAAAWIVTGLAAVVVAVSTREPPPAPPGPVSVWVADRDGGAIVGLDDDLFEARRLAWRWPLRLVTRATGGLWIVSAPAGDPDGLHAIEAVDREGRVLGRAAVPPVVDAAGLDDRLLVVAGRPGARALIEVPRSMRWRARPLTFEPTCCTVAGDRWVVGSADGRLYAFVPEVGLELDARVGRHVVDVEPGPERGTTWVLDAGPPARLFVVDAALAPRASVDVEPGWRAVVPVPAGDAVWLVGHEGQVARARARPSAVVALELVRERDGTRLGRAAADGSQLLVTSPGAVLRFDSLGRRVPGQGGFGFAVDVVLAGEPTARAVAPVSSP